MSKFTPLGERIFVAQSTKNEVELRKIKREIVGAFGVEGSVVGAARRLGVHQLTLRRLAKSLNIEADLKIERGVSRRFSPIGERIFAAQQENDVTALRKVKLEIVEAFRESCEDFALAAEKLGLSPQTLRKHASSLGLDSILGVERRSTESSVLAARFRVASEASDQREIEKIKAEIYGALERSRGMFRQASRDLGVTEVAFRQLVSDLGLSEYVGTFQRKGVPRTLTVRVDGRDVTHSIAEWSRIVGVKRTTILMRLRKGFTEQQALAVGDMRETAQPTQVASVYQKPHGSGPLRMRRLLKRAEPRPRKERAARPEKPIRVCKYSAEHPTPLRGDVCRACRAREKIESRPKRVCRFSAEHAEPKFGDICAECRKAAKIERDALRKRPRVCKYGSDHAEPKWGDVCSECRAKEREELRRTPSRFCKYSTSHAAPIKGEVCEACRSSRKPKKRVKGDVYVPSETTFPIGQMGSLQASFFPLDEPDDFSEQELDFDPAPRSRRKRRVS